MSNEPGVPGLLKGSRTVQSADYKSAGSNQIEALKFAQTTAADTWVEIHTVTTGKTFYVSGIVLSTEAAAKMTMNLGIGAAAAEVNIFRAALLETLPLMFPTPIKFSSGTRISVKSSVADASFYNLIGWEE